MLWASATSANHAASGAAWGAASGAGTAWRAQAGAGEGWAFPMGRAGGRVRLRAGRPRLEGQGVALQIDLAEWAGVGLLAEAVVP